MAYKWRALIAVCFGTYMATMDTSIVNVALPTLSREFNRSPDVVVWAILISNLVVTGLTLTAGRLGDLFGRKRIYVLGWVIFTIGMATAGFAQDITQLIAFRFFQAIGVSLALGNGNAIVAEAFPEHERGTALGTTGAVVGAGLMSGPILGGLLLEGFGWEAIFWLRVPIGLLAMTMAVLLIRPSQGAPSGQRRVDVPGAAFLFLTLSTLVLAVNRGQRWGWDSPTILGLFAVALVGLVAFLRVESRAASPVLSLALFRRRAFSIPVLSLVLNFSGQGAVTFLMPFYLINVRGYGTGHAGLILATVPAMMLLLSPLSGRVADRFRFRHQPTVGLALVSIGLASLASLDAGTSTALVVPRLALIGIGTAIFASPNSASIMSAVPRSALGTASAAVATARNIGTAAGLALASTIVVAVASASAGFSASRADRLPPDALLDGIHVAFIVAACVSSLAIVASLFRVGRAIGLTEPAPASAGG
ncbi:MAG: MFS transporter [Tepidiformaceae bacterium]